MGRLGKSERISRKKLRTDEKRKNFNILLELKNKMKKVELKNKMKKVELMNWMKKAGGHLRKHPVGSFAFTSLALCIAGDPIVKAIACPLALGSGKLNLILD